MVRSFFVYLLFASPPFLPIFNGGMFQVAIHKLPSEFEVVMPLKIFLVSKSAKWYRDLCSNSVLFIILFSFSISFIVVLFINASIA